MKEKGKKILEDEEIKNWVLKGKEHHNPKKDNREGEKKKKTEIWRNTEMKLFKEKYREPYRNQRGDEREEKGKKSKYRKLKEYRIGGVQTEWERSDRMKKGKTEKTNNQTEEREKPAI